MALRVHSLWKRIYRSVIEGHTVGVGYVSVYVTNQSKGRTAVLGVSVLDSFPSGSPVGQYRRDLRRKRRILPLRGVYTDGVRSWSPSRIPLTKTVDYTTRWDPFSVSKDSQFWTWVYRFSGLRGLGTSLLLWFTYLLRTLRKFTKDPRGVRGTMY